MASTIDEVRAFYNQNPAFEYARIGDRPEFLLTVRFMERYIRPEWRVLDVGGGPGRYAHHLARRGCRVTLMDLAEENVRFALARAEELDLPLEGIAGDAREADRLLGGPFDAVLLMGPMYHLLEEADRARAVESCLKLLRPGGLLFVSFISMSGGLIYMLRDNPDVILSPDPIEVAFRRALAEDLSYAGPAFTQAFFARPADIAPFMARFPLEKLHLFGQEGILSPCEAGILSKPPQVVEAWLDLAEHLAEREDLLTWSEHLMYIGRKRLS